MQIVAPVRKRMGSCCADAPDMPMRCVRLMGDTMALGAALDAVAAMFLGEVKGIVGARDQRARVGPSAPFKLASNAFPSSTSLPDTQS